MIPSARLSLRSRPAAPPVPAHDADEAGVGLCDCRKCLKERHRLRTHPLLAAALTALYDAGDTLAIVRSNHGCDPAACGLCHEARMAWAVLAQLECSFEGEYGFTSNPKLAQRRKDSEASRARPRSSGRWTPDSNGNYPILPIAVMVLMDLRKALEALHEGHGCGNPDCFVCEQAEVGAYLVPMLTAAVETTMFPCPAILHRRGVSPAGAQVLRLLEQSVPCR